MVTKNGSFRLFTIAGIDVYLNWLWFAAAYYLVMHPLGEYRGDVYAWCVIECVALFGMVLMHEFGHALACRQTGGQAHEIILWPLGGVAYVAPPQRPGAQLWSIAAGPLVNVALVPALALLKWALVSSGVASATPNMAELLRAVIKMNLVLLIFNLLPVYPLDGGQILRSLFWFVLGRARSLLVASIIGFVGVAALIVLAILATDLWLGMISLFVLMSCWQGLRQALAMGRVDDAPMRFGFACPSCHNAPRVGAFWICSHCRTAFDTFETRAQCPKCGATYGTTRCMHCGNSHPLTDWITIRPPPPPAQ